MRPTKFQLSIRAFVVIALLVALNSITVILDKSNSWLGETTIKKGNNSKQHIRTSVDQGTSIEVHDNNEENDPILNSTEMMNEHIEKELTESSSGKSDDVQNASVVVVDIDSLTEQNHNNKKEDEVHDGKENDPILNSTEIMNEHIEKELNGNTIPADQGAKIEVDENNEENDPILNLTEITNDEHIETEPNDTTSHATKSIIAARLGLLEASPGIIEEMSKVRISIVVSHCGMSVGWISDYIGTEYSIKDITIYSKCGKEVENIEKLEELSPTVNVVKLPNVGRNDHAYAYWIKENYDSIDKDKDGNDIVLFLKDNGGRYPSMKYHPINQLFTHVSKTGFGCIMKIGCNNCQEQCDKDSVVRTMQHRRQYILKFSKDSYDRLERDNNIGFVNDKYPNLKSWKEDLGFVIPESETMPVCYRGSFAAQKKQFLNHRKESWEKMVSSLSRGDNIAEGHYAERLWASILSDIDEDSASAVDEVLSQHQKTLSTSTRCGKASSIYIDKDASITRP